MISLDLDLSYFSAYYNIGKNAITQYQNMSLVEIMQVEAENGNTEAAEFLTKMTSDPEELARLFQLFNPQNRYLILLNMNTSDLTAIMEYLNPEELLLGISIFNLDVILDLMMELEPESLATVVLNKMDEDQFLNILPEEYLDEFLASDKIDRNLIMQSLEYVDDNELQKMMENYTGQSCYDDSDTILQTLSSLDDDDFTRAIYSFEPKGKQQLISNMLQEKPDLFEEFSAEAMVYPFTHMEKEDVLKSLTVLETEDLMPMVEDLPQEIMALIATQINPVIFAEVLADNFKDVIADCGFKM